MVSVFHSEFLTNLYFQVVWARKKIERMVQEADQYRAEDEVQKEKVTAKNTLESLAFNMKSTVEDDKLKDKISAEDKKNIIDKCNEVIAWLDRNQVGNNRKLFNLHANLQYRLHLFMELRLSLSVMIMSLKELYSIFLPLNPFM